MEKITLVSGLIIINLLIVACTQINEQKNRFINVPTTIPEMRAALKANPSLIGDTNQWKNQFPQNVTLTSNINGKHYKLKTDNNKIMELYIDGEQVAPKKIVQYKPVTDQMIMEFYENVAMINLTSKKIMQGAVAMQDSIEKQKANTMAQQEAARKSFQQLEKQVKPGK